MTRTEDDVRAALALLEGLVPDTDAAVVGLRSAVRRRRRRAVGTPGAAVRAVAAAAVVPVVLVGSAPARSPSAAPATAATSPGPDGSAFTSEFYFTVQARTVGGYDIRPRSVGPGAEHAVIVRTGGDQQVGALTAFRGDPSMVQIQNDRTGASQFLDVVGDGESIGVVNGQQAIISARTVRWVYAPPDRWVWLAFDPGQTVSRPTMLALAGSVRLVDPYPVMLPYRFEDLPDQLIPTNVSSSAYGSFVQFASFDVPGYDMTVFVTTDTSDPLPWDDRPDAYADYPFWPWAPTTVAGLPARCAEVDDPNPGERWCEVRLDRALVIVDGDHAAADHFDELVAGLRLAPDVTDPTTWFDAREAFPGV